MKKVIYKADQTVYNNPTTNNNMIKKTLLLLTVFVASTLAFNSFEATGASTLVANQLALNAVNGGNAEFIAQYSYNHLMHLNFWAVFMTILVASAMWLKELKKASGVAALFALMSVLSLPSCKPYQKPVYKEIKSNETAFVIPLEGDGASQVKFDSKAALEKHKVATKRIEVPTRWNQTGRGPGSGEWIPTVTVIIVDRSPLTRNWEAGSNGTSRVDQAIWVESSDSVGFSMGFNCTAFIKEEDTSQFLYWYSSGSLATVMDSEIRGRVQRVAAEESAKLPLDDLRDKKNQIAAAIQADVIPFFAERGITITTVGMFGGMTYENPEIQKSIDNVFVAQQQKNVALAKYDAQKKENERVILEAEGVAKQKTIAAEAEAKQRQIQADAEAHAIATLTKSIAEGGSNYLNYKQMEISLKQAERWDGSLPKITGGTAVPMLNAEKFLTK